MGLFMNGFKRPRRVSDFYTPPFWGDGSDGILTAGATYQADVAFDKYSGFCIKQFKEINWDPVTAETLTVDEPCRGLVLFVDGDVYIGTNATISMAKKGSVLPVNPSELLYLYGGSAQMRLIVDRLKALKGGNGGNGGDAAPINGTPGVGGTGGLGRICQGGVAAGGGAYGVYNDPPGGRGGSIVYPEVLGYPGKDPSGDGLWGGGGNANCGSGNRHRGGGRPYGAGGAGASQTTAGGDGEHTGGFILIIAKGSITIAGTIDVTGGNGGSSTGTSLGGGGGGAGGGVIAVFAKGYINTSSATKILTGGAGGTGYQSGTSGGEGTYYEERI